MSNVIHDVNLALRELLLGALKPPGLIVSETDILFKSPADMEQTTNTLSVFMFQVLQNPFLGNSEPERTIDNKIIFPPRVLDLLYMITPYAFGPDIIKNELVILEEIARTFHDHAFIESATLLDNAGDHLVSTGNPEMRIEPHNISLDDLNKLWGIFPGKNYKLSLFYTVTPVRIPSARETQVKRITEVGL